MELVVKNVTTSAGTVQAAQLKWSTSWLFVVDAPNGAIVCGSFDIAALEGFGLAAAQIVPAPGDPAFTVDEFVARTITNVNGQAADMGVTVGMSVEEAVAALTE